MTQKSMPQRDNDTFLQPLELPTLIWLAQRIPAWVTPNQLTVIGFLGACLSAIGYVLSRWHPAYLWLASLGLLINWFGDSLDGSLARVRKIERPRYGFFLDQNLDAFEQLLFAVGFGLSGFIRFELAMVALAAYFLLSILSLVRAVVTNVFAMAYGKIGLTETRIIFLIVNALMYSVPPQPFSWMGLSIKYPEVLSVAWTTLMLIVFLRSFQLNLRDLGQKET
jgi:archaetidylinositol phosphate synthase